MKKVFGWILAVLGGFFCFVGVMCIPVAFLAEDVPFAKRVFLLIAFAGFAALNGLLLRKGLQLRSNAPAAKPEAEKPSEIWMTSQYPALYLHSRDEAYRKSYMDKLLALGFREEDAGALFQFECGVLLKYKKDYLLDPRFTKNWFFGLKKPFFQTYPATKEDILKEQSLTVSELCKLIDEAQWHFWNSHEKNLSDAVWAEIYAWRLKGPGAEFAIRYFEKISEKTGVPMDNLAALSAQQGTHLNRYKWH